MAGSSKRYTFPCKNFSIAAPIAHQITHAVNLDLNDNSVGTVPDEESQSLRTFLSQRRAVSTLREWTQQSGIADRFYIAPPQFTLTGASDVDALLPEPPPERPQSPSKSTISSLSAFHFPSTQSTTSIATRMDIGTLLPEPPRSPTKSTLSSPSTLYLHHSQSTTSAGPASSSVLSDETARSFPETSYAPPSSIPELTNSSTSLNSTSYDTESIEPIPRQGVQLLVPDSVELLQDDRHHHSPTFQCSFFFLICFFESPDEKEWNLHCLHHFKGARPPRSNQCPLCDAQFYDFDGNESWKMKMAHLAEHIRNGQTLATSRPDFQLLGHLRRKRVISDVDYKELKWNDHLDYAPRPFVVTDGPSMIGRQESLRPVPQAIRL